MNIILILIAFYSISWSNDYSDRIILNRIDDSNYKKYSLCSLDSTALDKVDSLLKTYHYSSDLNPGPNKINLHSYYRKYLGLIDENGNIVVIIIGMDKTCHEYYKTWSTHSSNMRGGGTLFFSAKCNYSKQKIIEFYYNAPL